jgi:hypothetical protein
MIPINIFEIDPTKAFLFLFSMAGEVSVGEGQERGA